MIKSKLKKLGKIGILLAVKESYLLVRNVLGLKSHPFKTLRVIQREKDRSQQVLVLGLPVYVFLGGLVVVGLGRRWLGRSVEWGLAARLTALGVLGLAAWLGLYLGYWWMRVGRIKDER